MVNVNIEGVFKKVVMLIIFEVSATIHGPRNNSNGQVDKRWTWGIECARCASRWLGLLRTLAWRNYEQKIPTTKLQLQFFFAAHINYFELEQPPSPQLIELSRWVSKNPKTEDATASALIQIVIRFINLHASVRAKALTDPAKIVLEVVSLDAQLEIWEADLPSDWCFTLWDKDLADESSFNGKSYEYYDLWNSRTFNHYRWVRIVLNELLLEHIIWVPHHTPEHVAQKTTCSSKDKSSQNSHHDSNRYLLQHFELFR